MGVLQALMAWPVGRDHCHPGRLPSSRRLACTHADTLLDNLTVEEMLLYTAEMKNPAAELLAAKRGRVNLVIDQLALGGCRGVQIGNALNRGISGAKALRWPCGPSCARCLPLMGLCCLGVKPVLLPLVPLIYCPRRQLQRKVMLPMCPPPAAGSSGPSSPLSRGLLPLHAPAFRQHPRRMTRMHPAWSNLQAIMQICLLLEVRGQACMGTPPGRRG